MIHVSKRYFGMSRAGAAHSFLLGRVLVQEKPQELAYGVTGAGILQGPVGLPGPVPCRPLDQMSHHAPAISR